MSFWTEMSGTIILRKGCGCSVKTMVHGIYSETSCTVMVDKQTDSHTYYSVKIQCSLDGWDIKDYMERLVQCLKGYDQQAKMDMTVITPFSC